MRKHMLGTIAALLAIVLVAGAQTPGTETARAALEKVSVVRGETGVRAAHHDERMKEAVGRLAPVELCRAHALTRNPSLSSTMGPPVAAPTS